MTLPAASLSCLGDAGQQLFGWDEHQEYYAASTVKLAVAAACMLAVERGELTLEQTVLSRAQFASRVEGAPLFDCPADEVDPGMPAAGTPLSIAQCLERMITVSSNESTNLLIETLGAGGADAGTRGLASVAAACEFLGVPGVLMTRLICDAPAQEAGFTHTASAASLARLMWELLSGNTLQPESCAHLLRLLRAQEFPIIANTFPASVPWASKSGWDDAIRHDVAARGEPRTSAFRVLAICTEGYSAAGAQQLIEALAQAVLPPTG